VNRKCAVIKRFRRFVVKKASNHTSSFSLFLANEAKKKQRKPRRATQKKTKEAPLSLLLHKKNSLEHLLTMADVQHERGYQKQVGVNVG
jgi:hypothetical protein